ncbi:hypothetical protein Q3G72_001833 [Acer saccharum]|nr:hypothetical protein Q3G72_001833 [Acer saccharum]
MRLEVAQRSTMVVEGLLVREFTGNYVRPKRLASAQGLVRLGRKGSAISAPSLHQLLNLLGTFIHHGRCQRCEFL